MTVLSKPLLFGSRYTEGISQNYRRVDELSNSHFWIEKNSRIIDPTQGLHYPNGRRIYLPFDETTQKKLGQQWMTSQKRMWKCDDHEVLDRIDFWALDFDFGEHGRCWFNALKYQMEHGGKLVCGLMGHYDHKLGYVDVDYGY